MSPLSRLLLFGGCSPRAEIRSVHLSQKEQQAIEPVITQAVPAGVGVD
jgi:hypothetical protein